MASPPQTPTLPNSPRPTAITLMRLHALTRYLPGPRQHPSLSPSCKKVMRSVPKNLAIKNKDCPLGVTMGNQYTTVQNRNMQSHCKGEKERFPDQQDATLTWLKTSHRAIIGRLCHSAGIGLHWKQRKQSTTEGSVPPNSVQGKRRTSWVSSGGPSKWTGLSHCSL